MAATTLKPQAMDATTRLSSKIISATRDLTAASGDVAYTGVGFTPTCIIAMGVVDTTLKQSKGFADSSKTAVNMFEYIADTYFIDAQLLLIETGGGASTRQSAIVKTYDTDGFTLTWTKTGSPTGTATLKFLCFK